MVLSPKKVCLLESQQSRLSDDYVDILAPGCRTDGQHSFGQCLLRLTLTFYLM